MIKQCTFRKPTMEDVDALYDCIIPYAGESWQGKQAPVDELTVRRSLFRVVMASNFKSVLAEYEGQVVGLAFGYYAQSWWLHADATIDLFYVNPAGRGSDAARGLVRSIMREFKAENCGFLYTAPESGVGKKNNTMYENLFKKFGFHDIGGGRMIINLREYDANLKRVGV